MKKTSETGNKLEDVKHKAWQQRIAIIAATVIVIICCVVVMVKKSNNRAIERQREEATYQAEYEARMQREREEVARRDEEQRLRNMEYQRCRDSIAALPGVEETEPPKPTWSWNDIEKMVRDLTNENYYASIWHEEINTPKWVVIYTKGGKEYFRRFNAKSKTYGPKVRLIKDDTGKFHVSGNTRDKYYYDRGGRLVHEVNGIVKETFDNHHTIDLFTPEPVPDGYEDWEDYYYDNEEDLYFYHGGH